MFVRWVLFSEILKFEKICDLIVRITSNPTQWSIIIKYLKLDWKENNIAQDLDKKCSCAYIWTRIKAITSSKAPLLNNKRSIAHIAGLPPLYE